MDYMIHGIPQARTLERAAFPFSRGASQPRDRTQVSRIESGFFTSRANFVGLVTKWDSRVGSQSGTCSYVGDAVSPMVLGVLLVTVSVLHCRTSPDPWGSADSSCLGGGVRGRSPVFSLSNGSLGEPSLELLHPQLRLLVMPLLAGVSGWGSCLPEVLPGAFACPECLTHLHFRKTARLKFWLLLWPSLWIPKTLSLNLLCCRGGGFRMLQWGRGSVWAGHLEWEFLLRPSFKRTLPQCRFNLAHPTCGYLNSSLRRGRTGFGDEGRGWDLNRKNTWIVETTARSETQVVEARSTRQSSVSTSETFRNVPKRWTQSLPFSEEAVAPAQAYRAGHQEEASTTRSGRCPWLGGHSPSWLGALQPRDRLEAITKPRTARGTEWDRQTDVFASVGRENQV